MPYHRRSYGYRKRRYHRKHAYKRQIKIATGIPNTYFAKFRYVTHKDISPDNATDIRRYVISCNSIFDPDVSLVGHQPMFVDQVCAMGYDYWAVRKATIKVTPVYGIASNLEPIYIGVIMDQGTVPDPTVDATSTARDAMLEYSERNRGSVKPMMMGVIGNPIYLTRKYISSQYDANQFWHVKNFSEIYNTGGQYGTCNPTGPTSGPLAANSVNWNIWTCMVNDAVSPSSTGYQVRIEVQYSVLFLRDDTTRIIQS